MKKIVLTGGGTAGHVTPNLALLPSLREEGFDISYIGSYEGIESRLIKEAHIPYYPIASGKLRRYFDWKNFTDPFRVIKGCAQARHLLKHLNPDVVFSKGGFVSVPVVLVAKSLHIPAIIHESDITPGLANKIAIRGASKVCCNFPETLAYLPKEKAVLTGCPIREELLHGDKEKALVALGFTQDKPVLMIMGGSSGSVFINNAVREALDDLLETFQIIHLCGRGNLDANKESIKGYRQFEYVSEELPDYFAAADLLLSRAGANAICEIIALKKPNILVPLSLNASRGDQILNARSFEKQGFSYFLEEETVTRETLTKAVHHVYDNRQTYIAAMKESHQQNSIKIIVDLLKNVAK